MLNEEVGRCAVGAACALFDPQGRILLVRHSYGRLNWELPGGGALPGEDPRTAAQRELLEETSLDLSPDALTGVYFEPGHDFGPFMHFVFRVAWREGLAPAAVPPEITEVGFYEFDALPRPISDFTQRRILDAMADPATFETVDQRIWFE